jgi:UDP-glucuronate decarboxylase
MARHADVSILLTGGTGFFGKALLRHSAGLEQKGQEVPRVTMLSRNPNRFEAQYPKLVAHQWLHLVQSDVCNPDSLPRGQAFTHVLHAATDSTNGPQLSPLQRYDQIVNGTKNVLDLAVASSASRVLLTSSGGVYGPQPPDIERIPEDYLGMPNPLNPNNAYSVAKRAAEHLCALYAEEYGIEIVVARCFAFVGQDLPLDVHFAIGNFIRDALWADEIVVNGDGTPIRSYLDQRDLARWLLALLHEGKAGEAYNVGSDQAISIADLAYLVRDLVSPDKPVRILGKAVDNAERNRYVPDISKIGRDLGLRPSFSLEQSILDAVETAAG